jgi:DHA2 family lincomycin resistance protein-like MFS transporter
VDVISIILSTIGFGGIVYGFSSSGEGQSDLMSPQVYGVALAGVISILLFVLRQFLVEDPLMDLRAFRYPMFSLTSILLIIVMMSLFSTMILLPFLFQGALGMTVFASGLLMLPGSILNGLISPLTGKLFDRFGPRALVIPGTAFLVIITWFFTRVSVDTNKLTFLVLHICIMIAISMIMMPTQTNGLNQLPPRYYPHGTAILNTLQQVAGAIGVAFFIGIMSSGQRSFLEKSSDPTSPAKISEAMVAGVHNAFMIGLGFAIIALILALFLRRTSAPQE